MSMAMDENIKISVLSKASEFPSPNHAVSEKGIYRLRNTIANSTEKVTVPISWYLPSKYGGNFFENIVYISLIPVPDDIRRNRILKRTFPLKSRNISYRTENILDLHG
jgi:hypothetical protein